MVVMVCVVGYVCSRQYVYVVCVCCVCCMLCMCQVYCVCVCVASVKSFYEGGNTDVGLGLGAGKVESK